MATTLEKGLDFTFGVAILTAEALNQALSSLVERGKLQLHGAYFGVATGVLQVRDPETGRFAPATDAVPGRVPMMRCD